jgi:hypothetical protein
MYGGSIGKEKAKVEVEDVVIMRWGSGSPQASIRGNTAFHSGASDLAKRGRGKRTRF